MSAETRKVHPHPPPTDSGGSPGQLTALALGSLAATAGCILLGISYLACPTGQHASTPHTLIAPLCADTHYKYLIPLLVPVTAWFAIANWVGWQYFRFA